MSYSPADARGQELVWLLTIDVLGRTIRLATTPAEVDEQETGATLHYVGALSVVEPPSVALADGGELPEASASVEWLHPTEAGWAGLLDEDPNVQDATAELALWVVGTEWHRRQVVAYGRLNVTGYGAPEEPVSASIALTLGTDRGLVPTPEQSVSVDRWTATGGNICPEGSRGLAYPLVIGAPGYPGTDLEDHRGWPALVVRLDDSDRSNVTNPAVVLIHGDRAAVAGDTVKVYNLTTGLSAAGVSVSGALDDTGQPVATASIAAATLAISEGDELWASAETTTPVGLLSVGTSTGGIEGAGDVVRWLLSRSTVEVDYGAMEGDLDRLNLYKLSAVLNEPRAPTEIIGDLLTFLPCAWYVAPHGLALRVWPSDDDQPILTVGPSAGCERISPIAPSDPDETRDAYRIEYDADRADGETRRTLAIVPSPDPEDPSQIENVYAVRSYARGGLPPTRYALRWADTIAADMIADTATAFSVLYAKARRESRLRYAVTYACPPEYQFVTPGTVVQWTDADVSRDERARVVGIEYGLLGCSLTLETL